MRDDRCVAFFCLHPLQNHLLQILALFAMEPPVSLSGDQDRLKDLAHPGRSAP
jgi:hypothetical protein